MANAGNPWDNSSTILSDQRGQNYAQAIRGFGSGINEYFDRKRQQEKEDATVEWLNQNEGAVHQLFPQLENVKDPVERKKVIKAGIKGAGLENLVQVKQFMDSQGRQAENQRMQGEMQKAQIAHLGAETDQARAMMDDRASEGRAISAAGAPGAGMADQIAGGADFSQLDPNAPVDRSGVYMRSGGRNPAMIQAMAKDKEFVPHSMMTEGGLPMVQTSPNSWIPDPRVRDKSLKAPGAAGGPEYSKDKKFYRNGPDDKWTPIKVSAAANDATAAADLKTLPGEISTLEQEIADAAAESRKGNKKPGPDWMPGFDTYDERIQKKQTELFAKKKRLRELTAGDAAGESDVTPQASAGGRKPVSDPFSYVLGN